MSAMKKISGGNGTGKKGKGAGPAAKARSGRGKSEVENRDAGFPGRPKKSATEGRNSRAVKASVNPADTYSNGESGSAFSKKGAKTGMSDGFHSGQSFSDSRRKQPDFDKPGRPAGKEGQPGTGRRSRFSQNNPESKRAETKPKRRPDAESPTDKPSRFNHPAAGKAGHTRIRDEQPGTPSGKRYSGDSPETERPYRKRKPAGLERDEQPASRPYSGTKGASFGRKKDTGYSADGPKKKSVRQGGKHGFREDGTIRLNKFIANSGVCSRREADTLIESGAVSVNGVVVTELGTRISRTDKVQFGGETLTIEKKVYVLLNKPKGYITTVDDPQERNTVMMLIKDACQERIYPVGRLDRNTSGLLLFTNDGEMAKKLTHPSHKVRKVYHVELDKALSKADMLRLTEGVELDDGPMAVDEIAYTGSGNDKKNIGLVIHSGRTRIVRRLFEALEYNVVKLDRVAFANLTKKDLPRGRWRFLDEKELNLLQMI